MWGQHRDPPRVTAAAKPIAGAHRDANASPARADAVSHNRARASPDAHDPRHAYARAGAHNITTSGHAPAIDGHAPTSGGDPISGGHPSAPSPPPHGDADAHDGEDSLACSRTLTDARLGAGPEPLRGPPTALAPTFAIAVSLPLERPTTQGDNLRRGHADAHAVPTARLSRVGVSPPQPGGSGSAFVVHSRCGGSGVASLAWTQSL